MRKLWVIGGLAFLGGLLLGSTGTALLASRASKLFLQVVRLSFASEEQARAVDAWKAHDLRAAARHAACGVDLEGNSRAFDPSSSMWDPTYVLMGFWVNDKTQYPVSDRAQLLALAHARFGRILEESGRSEEAAREYTDAGRLGGNADIQRWRNAAEVTLGSAAPHELDQAPPRADGHTKPTTP